MFGSRDIKVDHSIEVHELLLKQPLTGNIQKLSHKFMETCLKHEPFSEAN